MIWGLIHDIYIVERSRSEVIEVNVYIFLILTFRVTCQNVRRKILEEFGGCR
jgi:hypothetical protein